MEIWKPFTPLLLAEGTEPDLYFDVSELADVESAWVTAIIIMGVICDGS